MLGSVTDTVVYCFPSVAGMEFRELLTRQEKFVDDLVKLVKAVASEKADRPKKIERLQVF